MHLVSRRNFSQVSAHEFSHFTILIEFKLAVSTSGITMWISTHTILFSLHFDNAWELFLQFAFLLIRLLSIIAVRIARSMSSRKNLHRCPKLSLFGFSISQSAGDCINMSEIKGTQTIISLMRLQKCQWFNYCIVESTMAGLVWQWCAGWECTLLTCDHRWLE